MALLISGFLHSFDAMAETQMTVDMDTEQHGMLLHFDLMCIIHKIGSAHVERLFQWYVETMTIDKEWGN